MIIGALTPFLLVYPLFAVQTGTVNGVVRDAAGMPKAGVRIAAKPADPSEGDVLVGIDQSDAAGMYQLALPSGRFHIVAGAAGQPWFYPGTFRMAAAEVISVTDGSVRESVNFTVSTVSGTVRDSSGMELWGVPVAAVATSTVGPNSSPVVVSTVTDGSGSYRLDLFQGEYYLLAGKKTDLHSSQTYAGTSSIMVTEAVSGYDLVIEGMVTSTRDLALYLDAVKLIEAARYAAARLNLHTLLELFPDSKMAPDARYAVAESLYREGTSTALLQAQRQFLDFMKFFPTSPLQVQAKQRLQDLEKRIAEGANR
jgi:hypothetical protein